MIATWDTIRIDREGCTGRRSCEIVCSLSHEHVVNPDKARISIRRRYEESLYIPFLCHNCANPDCVAVCPTGALSHGVDGVVLADQVQCTGCELCVQACPHEAIRYNEATSRILVCDHCGGKPLCVEFCATQAVQYPISS
ncbi:MAG: 4Fe-4S dicluster domain-containing protein [Dehalococcoidia bacterium]|nr:4Fe-4S dicluster domain-containing protein [Dehalococcoidia bacterium]